MVTFKNRVQTVSIKNYTIEFLMFYKKQKQMYRLAMSPKSVFLILFLLQWRILEDN